MPLTLNRASVAEMLKSETYEHHTSSEALIGPLLASIRDNDDYVALLHIFYGFFQPVEELIAAQISNPVLPDIHERRNAKIILEDLASLGKHEPPVICHSLPAINDLPAALGALYVLEGSTLGGRVIRKMLLKHPSLSLDESKLKFFNGYGDATGEKWKAFQQCINRYDHQSEEIITAARDTFSKFSNWIRTRS